LYKLHVIHPAREVYLRGITQKTWKSLGRAGHTWYSLRSLGITAYRKIADLRPVYRESYNRHGLSFEPDRMRC
jgi:hypothetical protein